MIDSWFESLKVAFGGFAWPWMWLAFPLPWLAGWLLPPHRNTSASLKVPYGRRLDAIATVGGRSRGLHIAALAWLA